MWHPHPKTQRVPANRIHPCFPSRQVSNEHMDIYKMKSSIYGEQELTCRHDDEVSNPLHSCQILKAHGNRLHTNQVGIRSRQ
jgi:hypothetical protein